MVEKPKKMCDQRTCNYRCCFFPHFFPHVACFCCLRDIMMFANEVRSHIHLFDSVFYGLLHCLSLSMPVFLHLIRHNTILYLFYSALQRILFHRTNKKASKQMHTHIHSHQWFVQTIKSEAHSSYNELLCFPTTTKISC